MGVRLNHITILTLRIRTDRSEQTVQTRIRRRKICTVCHSPSNLHTCTGKKNGLVEGKYKEKCPKYPKFRVELGLD